MAMDLMANAGFGTGLIVGIVIGSASVTTFAAVVVHRFSRVVTDNITVVEGAIRAMMVAMDQDRINRGPDPVPAGPVPAVPAVARLSVTSAITAVEDADAAASNNDDDDAGAAEQVADVTTTSDSDSDAGSD